MKAPFWFFIIIYNIVVVIDAACVERRVFLVWTQPDVALPSLKEMVRNPRLAYIPVSNWVIKTLECKSQEHRDRPPFSYRMKAGACQSSGR